MAEAKEGWKSSRTSAMHSAPETTRAFANLLLDTVTANTASWTRSTFRRLGRGARQWHREFVTKNTLKRGCREGGVTQTVAGEGDGERRLGTMQSWISESRRF